MWAICQFNRCWRWPRSPHVPPTRPCTAGISIIAPHGYPCSALSRQCSVAERCECLGGDFFVAVPTGYDAYLLKSAVHGFDDDAVKSVRNCRKAIQRDGALLIIEEIVVPRQTMGNTNKLVDLDLLVHFGGKERTAGEYEGLLNDAGFTLAHITSVMDNFFSLIGATPN